MEDINQSSSSRGPVSQKDLGELCYRLRRIRSKLIGIGFFLETENGADLPDDATDALEGIGILTSEIANDIGAISESIEDIDVALSQSSEEKESNHDFDEEEQ